MNRFFTLLLAASCLTAVGQGANICEYPELLVPRVVFLDADSDGVWIYAQSDDPLIWDSGPTGDSLFVQECGTYDVRELVEIEGLGQLPCGFSEEVLVLTEDCGGSELEFFCGDGTVYDVESGKCIVANPSDSNFDGCVQLNDLLDLLSAYGNCSAEESPWQCGDPLEYQGYDYETVQIGEQCWFAENLRAEDYRNGDAIETLAGNTSEDCSTYYGGEGLVAAYGGTWGCSVACDEPFNPCADFETALNAFGRHYNGVAVQDERELCPSGWHPSTDEEWMELELLSGMTQADVQTFGWRGDVASTLKSSDLWCDDTSGTNEWGFAARPGGIIGDDCGYAFEALGIGSWWTHSASGDVGRRSLSAADDRIYRDYALNTEGMMSIRCIKD